MTTYKPSVAESMDFAKSSSEIEGEYSTDAYRCHLQAWELARGWTPPLTLSKLLLCHQLLLGDLHPDIAGRIRTVDVWVGKNKCPSPMLIDAMLQSWFDSYEDPQPFSKLKYPEEAIKAAHVEFESIHPFVDGNGRVGRCIMNWHRTQIGLPLIIIHPGKEQMNYYKWFNLL